MSALTWTNGVPVLPPIPILPGAVIVQSADSLTKGDHIGVGDDPSYSWAALLTPQIAAAFTAAGKTPPTFINTAVDGQTTSALISGITAQLITPAPTDIFLMVGVNDSRGVATDWATYANYLTIFTTVFAALPNCKFHCFSSSFAASETPVIGSGANDGDLLNKNSMLWRACLLYPGQCEFFDIRNAATHPWEIANNTTPVSTGLLTQDGTHPSKAAITNAPNGGVGIQSNAAFSFLTLALS